MNTAQLNAIQIDGASRSIDGVIGPTSFASTATRLGVDAQRSTATQTGVDARRSTGQGV